MTIQGPSFCFPELELTGEATLHDLYTRVSEHTAIREGLFRLTTSCGYSLSPAETTLASVGITDGATLELHIIALGGAPKRARRPPSWLRDDEGSSSSDDDKPDSKRGKGHATSDADEFADEDSDVTILNREFDAAANGEFKYLVQGTDGITRLMRRSQLSRALVEEYVGSSVGGGGGGGGWGGGGGGGGGGGA